MTLPFEGIIREFRFPEDYASCLQIWQNAGGGVNVSPSDTIEEIAKKVERDPDLFLVATIGNDIVGTVIGGFDGRRGMVYHLAVVPEHRNQGIGRQLMQEVEQRLVTKGCRKMYLMMQPGQPELMGFYNKLGWFEMNVKIAAREVNFR